MGVFPCANLRAGWRGAGLLHETGHPLPPARLGELRGARGLQTRVSLSVQACYLHGLAVPDHQFQSNAALCPICSGLQGKMPWSRPRRVPCRLGSVWSQQQRSSTRKAANWQPGKLGGSAGMETVLSREPHRIGLPVWRHPWHSNAQELREGQSSV